MFKFAVAVGLGAAALTLGACASQSGNPSAANQQGAQQKQVAKQQHMVCITEPNVGSHIPHTTCMTQAQYKELQKERELQREKMQSAPNQGSCSGQAGGCDNGQPPRGRH